MATKSASVTYSVLGHANAALGVAGGNNQTIITGGTLGAVTLNLTNSGTNLSPLDVSTLSNLTGSTGTAVVASGGTGAYTATGFDTTTVGLSKTLGTSLSAGDQQSLSGANALATKSASVTYSVYDHASGSAGGILALGNIHTGYGSPVTSNTVSATNASGTRVDLAGGAAAIGNISLNSLTGIIAGNSGSISATLATGQGVGAINQGFTYTFADDSSLSGASSNVGAASLTVTGQVYSGMGVWNTDGSGNWSDFGKWSANGGTPGLAAGFLTGSDTATFDNTASLTGPVTVTLNAVSPSVSAVTFNNTVQSYTIAKATTEVLKLNNTLNSAAATVTNSGGTHTISAPVELDSNATVSVTNANDLLTLSGNISQSGTHSLTKTGLGTLNLNGAQSYDNLAANAGTTNVNGSLGTNPGTGTAAVTVGASTKLKFGSVSQKLSSLTIGAGATVTFTSGPAAFADSGKAFGSGSAVVPEPGTLGLLLVGALGVLGRRRRA